MGVLQSMQGRPSEVSKDIFSFRLLRRCLFGLADSCRAVRAVLFGGVALFWADGLSLGVLFSSSEGDLSQ